jgi:hypothetical protein
MIELMNIYYKKFGLPYILIPHKNKHLKYLIDTGFTRSFMNPGIADAHFKQYLKFDPYEISTTHGSSIEKFSATIPCPKTFASKLETLKFHIFKFHRHFDCLLGIDNLENLKSIIDVTKRILKLPNVSLPLHFQSTDTQSNELNLNPHETQTVKIRINNINNGNAVIPLQKSYFSYRQFSTRTKKFPLI